MENKESNKLCIMIVPHAAKVKRFTIPSWLPKAISISILLIIISLGLFINNIYSSYISLKERYNVKTTEVNSLKKENEEKDIEIYNLRIQTNKLYEKSAEVNNKLIEIDKLQRQLEKMAGIQNLSRGSRLAESQKLQDMEFT